MPRGTRIQYDDTWILERYETFRNWLTLCEMYNAEHSTNIGYNTFKAHCNRELSVNHMYSDEQEDWLREHYPILGRYATTEAFNERFCENKTVNAIKVHCIQMGLKVSDERRKKKAVENTGRCHCIGESTIGSHGEKYVKTPDGWKREKELVYGPVPKGMNIVHLDGDVTNNNRENLVAIDRQSMAMMTANRFWSEHPEITRTGIMCCELEMQIKKSSAKTIPIK